MSFDEFEKQPPDSKIGMTYETEQEYYQWEAIITELEYFNNKLAR